MGCISSRQLSVRKRESLKDGVQRQKTKKGNMQACLLFVLR
ncbi:hypothetical protein JGUZn3_21270 [Entomobacter blattae]|uniref:Uncharacterized protein n=1 Tax=Entomobacter blattae TaxID=2762277 RepID=A0A7H1NU70_9PROT|nr:hypothetical protein JGUZn3_21270 [Entomobacter blattae]